MPNMPNENESAYRPLVGKAVRVRINPAIDRDDAPTVAGKPAIVVTQHQQLERCTIDIPGRSCWHILTGHLIPLKVMIGGKADNTESDKNENESCQPEGSVYHWESSTQRPDPLKSWESSTQRPDR